MNSVTTAGIGTTVTGRDLADNHEVQDGLWGFIVVEAFPGRDRGATGAEQKASGQHRNRGRGGNCRADEEREGENEVRNREDIVRPVVGVEYQRADQPDAHGRGNDRAAMRGIGTPGRIGGRPPQDRPLGAVT